MQLHDERCTGRQHSAASETQRLVRTALQIGDVRVALDSCAYLSALGITMQNQHEHGKGLEK